MSEYGKGRRFEYVTRDDLTDNGYAVARAAGSKGGTKGDLFAFKPGQLLIVQCKRTDRALSAEEWDRLVEVAGWIPCAVPVLAVPGPRGVAVAYMRLLGPKVPGKQMRSQPAVPFLLDEVA